MQLTACVASGHTYELKSEAGCGSIAGTRALRNIVDIVRSAVHARATITICCTASSDIASLISCENWAAGQLTI